jgi:acyl-CoA thioesterase FadM
MDGPFQARARRTRASLAFSARKTHGPTRYGDRLTFNLWVMKVGRTSCELRIEASLGGELRMRVKQVLVFISSNTSRATEIPPELVSRMHRFAAGAAAPGVSSPP